MNRALPILVAVVATGLLAPAPARAQVVFGDVEVRPEPTKPGSEAHGYAEYRFAVTNRSARQAHRVTLALPRNSYPIPDTGLRSIRRTVEVGPGVTARVGLLQPCLPIYGQGLEVAVDGQVAPQPAAIPIHQNRGSSSRAMMTPEPVYLLAGRKVAPGLGPQLGVPMPGMPPLASIQEIRWELPAEAWTTTWLGYSSFDGVVVTGQEFSGMPADVREALWQYAACGGCLVILGPAQLPEGAGRPEKAENLETYPVGFGLCLVVPNPQAQPRADRPVQSIVKTRDALKRVASVGRMSLDFPVVENVSVPVRGLFVVMIAFALVIGPVNLYLLSRWKRRIWLLWTVPAISLVTCLLVFGYMVLAEGWQGHSRTEGLTVLDEASHRATTLGLAGYYAPLTPGEGLHFGRDTELAPQLGTDEGPGFRRPRPPSAARTLDWTADQHLASGWVTARVPAYFKLRKSETRRERLTVRRGPGGKLTVVNGLGTPVTRLWLADRKGKVYGADAIPAGGEAALTARDETADGDADALRTLFGRDWAGHYRLLTEHPELYLRPGCYLAALDGDPFIEDAFRGSRRKSRGIVYGIMKEPVHAD